MDRREVELVEEVNGMKFISGANLGFRLKDLDKLFPFYNLPGARGEDAFLSICIGACSVRKVPCYTFHDGFSAFPKLPSGVLPIELKAMHVHASGYYKRFLRTCVGWIRYKPLLTYITRRADYCAEMVMTREALCGVIPKMCAFFENDDVRSPLKELAFYQTHVTEHAQGFERTKRAWQKIAKSL